MSKYIEIYCDLDDLTLGLTLYPAGTASSEAVVNSTARTGKPGFFLANVGALPAGRYDVLIANGLGADQVVIGETDEIVYQCHGIGFVPSVSVLPAVARQEPPPPPNTIVAYIGAGNLISHSLYEADEVTPLELSGKALTICIANVNGATIVQFDLPATTGNDLAWALPEIVRNREAVYSWAYRDRNDSDALVASGELHVKYAARRTA